MEHESPLSPFTDGKVILECVVGSTTHGTAVQDGLEDLDLMAVVIEDRSKVIGFVPKDTWVRRTKPMGVRSEAGDIDWAAYGLRKYLHLALKGNPSILLALFAAPEQTRILTMEGSVLRTLIPDIVSQQAFNPFRGYMQQQHERLKGERGQKNVTRPELVERYGFDTKYAAHIVRLGLQGSELMSTGKITLPMKEEERKLCVDIRTGKYNMTQVSELICEVESQLEKAKESSPLPLEPDSEKVERWMISAYLNHWNDGSKSFSYF